MAVCLKTLALFNCGFVSEDLLELELPGKDKKMLHDFALSRRERGQPCGISDIYEAFMSNDGICAALQAMVDSFVRKIGG